MKRYNVDMGMLHEEADGPWLPGGELNNDWVSNVLAFVSNYFSASVDTFKFSISGGCRSVISYLDRG